MKLKDINNNPLFQGLIFLIYLSIGDRISEGLNPYVRNLIFSPIIRYIAIVAAAYISTKNILSSVVIMMIYVIVFDNFLNPDSSFSLVGRKMPEDYQARIEEEQPPNELEDRKVRRKPVRERFSEKYRKYNDDGKYQISIKDAGNTKGYTYKKNPWIEVQMNMRQSSNNNKINALDESKIKEYDAHNLGAKNFFNYY